MQTLETSYMSDNFFITAIKVNIVSDLFLEGFDKYHHIYIYVPCTYTTTGIVGIYKIHRVRI